MFYHLKTRRFVNTVYTMASSLWLMLAVLVSVRFRFSLFVIPGSDFAANIVDLRSIMTVLRFGDDFWPCVALFNWEKRPSHLHLLLSLCGDVHFNPGPDFPCGICGSFVLD